VLRRAEDGTLKPRTDVDISIIINGGSGGASKSYDGCIRLTDASEMAPCIDKITQQLTAASASRFSDDIIDIRVESPDAAELTLIDLPGIIHSVKDDAHVSDIAQVKAMLTEYIKQPQTLVLVVMEAGIDTERQGALTLVKEQPEWERCVV
jgi:hypothetical protein